MSISWSYVSKHAVLQCRHTRDQSHNQMYWFKQQPGESMTLIVYSFGSADRLQGGEKPKNISLFIVDLKLQHTAVYYCAASYAH
uniref:Ig-like domain-containing protein n=1 Tax=Salarias fasciatus TaxID=181472 RepID=A0A672JMJ5_SALFA